MLRAVRFGVDRKRSIPRDPGTILADRESPKVFQSHSSAVGERERLPLTKTTACPHTARLISKWREPFSPSASARRPGTVAVSCVNSFSRGEFEIRRGKSAVPPYSYLPSIGTQPRASRGTAVLQLRSNAECVDRQRFSFGRDRPLFFSSRLAPIEIASTRPRQKRIDRDFEIAIVGFALYADHVFQCNQRKLADLSRFGTATRTCRKRLNRQPASVKRLARRLTRIFQRQPGN